MNKNEISKSISISNDKISKSLSFSSLPNNELVINKIYNLNNHLLVNKRKHSIELENDAKSNINSNF